MAVAYQSHNNDGPTAGDRTVTKPTGLAVGDMMIGIANSENEETIGFPSGFTTLATQDGNTGGGNGGTLKVGYKIADASDVAASNFTFTGVGNVMAAAIVRVTGASTDIQAASDSDSGVTATPTLTMGVTPSQPSSLLLFILHASSNSNAARTASAYAVTTDNPSWTEIVDINTTSGNDLLLAVAYASRTETTATGDATVTLSGTSGGIAGVLLSIAPVTDVGLTPSVINLVASIQAPTPGSSFVISSPIVETASVQAPTVTTAGAKWTTPNKSSSTWDNTNKTV